MDPPVKVNGVAPYVIPIWSATVLETSIISTSIRIWGTGTSSLATVLSMIVKLGWHISNDQAVGARIFHHLAIRRQGILEHIFQAAG